MNNFFSKLFVSLIFIIANHSLYSIDDSWFKVDTPTYYTSVSGYSSNDQVYSSIKDNDGNIIISGYFEGKMKFGNITIISNGDKDLFVAKRNSAGNWLWAVNGGGNSSDYAYGLASDSAGNIYLTGYFYETAYFGDISLSSNGGSDVYFASLSSDGQWRWAVSAGSNSYDKGYAASVDNNYNVYFTGSFQSNTVFGNDTLNSLGQRDVFISKLDSAGNWIKSVNIGSNSSDESFDIEMFGNNVVIGGYFKNTMYINNDSLVSAGNEDGFIAVADSLLNFISYNRMGSTVYDAVLSVTTFDNNIYSTGYFSGISDFDEVDKTTAGGRDVFAAVSDSDCNWNNVTVAGSSSDDEGKDILIDNNKIYVTGYFRSSADFDNISLTSAGDKDVFLGYLDTNLVWQDVIKGGSSSMDESVSIVKTQNEFIVTGNFYRETKFGSITGSSIGGIDVFLAELNEDPLTWSSLELYAGYSDIAQSEKIAKDNFGNKYIAGSFYGQANFGSNILSSTGGSDGFVTKTGPAGYHIWVKNIKGSEDATIKSVTSDNELNVYVCGTFSGTAKFGSIQKTSTGLNDIFVAKLDKNGTWLWVKTSGNFLFDEANDIIYYDDNHIYVTGYYTYPVAFGSVNLSGSSDNNAFAACIDTDGNWQWAVKAGGTGYDMGNAVATDFAGNCIFVGSFEGTSTFGSESITSYGNDDFFISKLNKDGDWLWTKTSGSNTWRDAANDVDIDTDGNIYVTGQFNNYATFNDRYLISKGDVDVFVVKLDTNGNWGFLKSAGSEGFDSGTGLFVDGNDVYLTGTFSDTLNIDNVLYASYDEKDIFFAKLDTSGTFNWVKTANGSLDDAAVGVIKDERGNLQFTGVFVDSLTIGNKILYTNTKVDKNFYIASWGKNTPSYEWNYKTGTEFSAEITIPDSINPQINGEAFSEYDAVGVYYELDGNEIFGGFGHYLNGDLTFTIWSDDSTTSFVDGFKLDSNYKFKLWDYETENTYNTNVHYSSGNGIFEDNSISVVRYLPKPEVDTVTINLHEGWNFISSYVDPFDNSVENIFEFVEGSIAIVKDGAKFYIPRFSFRTMDDWYLKKSYKVYAKNNTSISLEGFYFPYTSTNIYLTEGWNLIPYLNKNSLDIDVFFETLIDENILLIVKDDMGNLFIPSLGFDLINQLNAGRGYYIYVNQDVNFIMPTD